jgi:predicted Zn-dependent peptidase
VLDRPGAPQAVVRAGHRGIDRLNPAYESLLLFNQIFGGQFTSRLNETLREQHGFTYGVRSHFECRRGAGPFSIGASLQSDRLAEALAEIRRELAEIVSTRPPTQEELEDARRALIEGQPRHFETPAALVNRYANLLVHGLPPEHEAGFADRLQQVDRDALIDAARSHVHPGAMVFVVVADAAQVLESLKRLDWVDPDVIDE